MGLTRRPKSPYLTLVTLEMETLKEYAQQKEDDLERHLKRFNEWYDEKTTGMSEEEQDEFGEFYSDEYQSLTRVYPDLFRSSTVITIFSVFEKNLKRVCKNVERKFNVDKPLKKRPKISDCSTYIAKHADMEHFFDSSNEWIRINGVYRQVRNAFAHNQGQLTDEEFELLFTELRGLHVEISQPLKDIHLEKDFCFMLNDDIINFFDSMVDNMPKSFLQR